MSRLPLRVGVFMPTAQILCSRGHSGPGGFASDRPLSGLSIDTHMIHEPVLGAFVTHSFIATGSPHPAPIFSFIFIILGTQYDPRHLWIVYGVYFQENRVTRVEDDVIKPSLSNFSIKGIISQQKYRLEGMFRTFLAKIEKTTERRILLKWPTPLGDRNKPSITYLLTYLWGVATYPLI